MVAGPVGDGARRKMFQRQMDVKVAALRADMGITEGSSLTRDIEQKVRAMKSGGKTDREELAQDLREDQAQAGWHGT